MIIPFDIKIYWFEIWAIGCSPSSSVGGWSYPSPPKKNIKDSSYIFLMFQNLRKKNSHEKM